MSASNRPQWGTVNKQLVNAIRRAVSKGGVMYQIALKAEVSKPGTGRYYARLKHTRAIAKGKHNELTTDQVQDIMAREAERFFKRFERARTKQTRELGAVFRGRALQQQLKLPKAKTLRGMGVHRASAPGRAPAIDTGTLRRSLQIDPSRLKRPNNPTVRVGSNLQYAKQLEEGRRHMAPRPYFRPVAARMRKPIASLFLVGDLLRQVVVK